MNDEPASPKITKVGGSFCDRNRTLCSMGEHKYETKRELVKQNCSVRDPYLTRTKWWKKNKSKQHQPQELVGQTAEIPLVLFEGRGTGTPRDNGDEGVGSTKPGDRGCGWAT